MDSKQEYLFYARVSSNGSDQIQSLDNQVERLKKLRNIIASETNLFKLSQLLSEVKSVTLGMSVKLQDIILDNPGITLVVTSIDRISRHIPDITFIKKNIKAIILANDDGSYKRYDVMESWRFINEKLAVATEEIETIKKRTQTIQKKRKSTDNELLDKCIVRTSNIDNILSKYIHSGLLTYTTKFIGMTQRIMNSYDWTTLNEFTLLKFDFNIKSYYPWTESFAHLKRNDVYDFVESIFHSEDIYIDKNLLKEYVNSHICLTKKQNVILVHDDDDDDDDEYDLIDADDEDDEDDDDDDDEDDDEYMDTLMKSFKKVLIKKMFKDLDETDKKSLKYILDKKKNKDDSSKVSKKSKVSTKNYESDESKYVKVPTPYKSSVKDDPTKILSTKKDLSKKIELVEYKKPNNTNKKSRSS